MYITFIIQNRYNQTKGIDKEDLESKVAFAANNG